MVLTREQCLKLCCASLAKMFCNYRQHDTHGKIDFEKKTPNFCSKMAACVMRCLFVVLMEKKNLSR